MIPTENSDFLVCTCMVRDRQQETQNIKLCLALCWLFDIKLLVTLLITFSLIPTSTDPSEDC